MVDSELEATPLWNMVDNVGLTAYDEEFSELEAAWPVIKDEVLKVAKNISRENDWQVHSYSGISMGNYVLGSGNWSVLPLFAYGKRKTFICR
jgi:hypothetical protein